MSVTGVMGIALEVPDLEAGRAFYETAGLTGIELDGRLHFRCLGQDRDAVILVPGVRKRLHHLALIAQAGELTSLGHRIEQHGGTIVEPSEGFCDDGLWLRDPHGMLIHITDGPAEADLCAEEAFEINQPGRRVRANRSAMRPKAAVGQIMPRRLGHVMLFTPNTMASVAFFENALDMGLADRAGEIVAFMCSRHGSDHHVVAFAQSPAVGFHHGSFQVGTPDEVGIAGDRLRQAVGLGDWGFGRHTIGSNFFHYIQDPWGSWFEYYADMDFIDDYEQWTPTVYGMEDSLHHWGPDVPSDFVHNYEAQGETFSAHARV